MIRFFSRTIRQLVTSANATQAVRTERNQLMITSVLLSRWIEQQLSPDPIPSYTRAEVKECFEINNFDQRCSATLRMLQGMNLIGERPDRGTEVDCDFAPATEVIDAVSLFMRSADDSISQVQERVLGYEAHFAECFEVESDKVNPQFALAVAAARWVLWTRYLEDCRHLANSPEHADDPKFRAGLLDKCRSLRSRIWNPDPRRWPDPTEHLLIEICPIVRTVSPQSSDDEVRSMLAHVGECLFYSRYPQAAAGILNLEEVCKGRSAELRVELLRVRGHYEYHTRKLNAALESYQAMVDLGSGTQAQAQALFYIASTKVSVAESLLSTNDYKQSERILGEVIQLLPSIDAAPDYPGKALDLANIRPQIRDLLNSLTKKGIQTQVTFASEGSSPRVLKDLMKSVRNSTNPSDAFRFATSLNTLGNHLYGTHKFERALEFYLEARSKFTSLGGVRQLADVNTNIGCTLCRLDRWQEAGDYFVIAVFQYNQLWLRDQIVESVLNYLIDELKIAGHMDVAEKIQALAPFVESGFTTEQVCTRIREALAAIP